VTGEIIKRFASLVLGAALAHGTGCAGARGTESAAAAGEGVPEAAAAGEGVPEAAAAGEGVPEAVSDAGAAPVAADGAAAADSGGGGEPTNGGTCSLEGSWGGTVPGGYFAGRDIAWEVAGDRSRGRFGTAVVESAFTVEGDVVVMRDVSAEPALLACAEPGRYRAAFAAGCGAVTFTVVEDPCGGRRATLDGARLERR
jgi:hypothetical protein